MYKRAFLRTLIIGSLTVCLCCLGCGYSYWADSLQFRQTINTSNFRFRFASNNTEDIRITLCRDNNEADLVCGVQYDDDTLYINEIDSATLSEVLNGTASIHIYYRLIPSENGLDEVNCGIYSLGTIPFNLVSTSASQLLHYDGKTINCGSCTVPSGAFSDYLNGISGFNHVLACEDGAVYGYVELSADINDNNYCAGTISSMDNNYNTNYADAVSSPDNAVNDVKLSTLGLSEEEVKKVLDDQNAECTINIAAIYSFSIPLAFEQNN